MKKKIYLISGVALVILLALWIWALVDAETSHIHKHETEVHSQNFEDLHFEQKEWSLSPLF